jgi:predicted nucleic acid-binding protein
MFDYYFDPTTKEHKYVKPELEKIITSGEEILTNTIIWIEVVHYLYKISKMPRRVLKERSKRLMRLSTLTIEPFDLTALSSSIDKLAELWQKPIGGRDATIVAMMQDEGVNRIFTHDGGFKELEFLEVIDPIPENLDEKE